MFDAKRDYSPQIIPRWHIYALVASLLGGMIALSYAINI